MSRRSPDFKRNNSIAELISDTRKPKRLADTAWYKIGEDEDYEIEFGAGWATVGGSGNPDAQFYMNEEGETVVIGYVDGGEEGSIIFNLPEENRPRYREPFVVAVEGGGTANVAIYPNGDVVLESFNG